ncbi:MULTISPECIES: S8 family peptidase [Lentzea]|uniref:S8 family peptidase n=1 Tax=Lentzea TaxID=165301 RepID=UPI001476244D|nr:S8/S53 family peptidase [Lentzea atacamensis]
MISLPGLENAASTLRALREERQARGEHSRFDRGTPPETDLDEILHELRRTFRGKHNGWAPEMGKNRTVKAVHGTPHIGGDTYPLKVENAFELPESSSHPKVQVGLIDTKVYPHPQFAGRLIAAGSALLPASEDKDDVYNHLDIHGTFSVGLILREAPEASVIVEAVLNHDGARATVWDVAMAMTRFADRDVSVLVMPLVCHTDDGEPPLVLKRAIDLLRNKVVVVAAAGNHGRQDPVKGVEQNNRPGFPAACDGVIAVGSVGRNGAPSDFNPRDAEWIDVFELGEQVLSTSVCGTVKYTVPMGCIQPPSNPVVFEGTAQWTGTSFAATTVAGKIAATMIATEQSAFDAVGELTGGRGV